MNMNDATLASLKKSYQGVVFIYLPSFVATKIFVNFHVPFILENYI